MAYHSAHSENRIVPKEHIKFAEQDNPKASDKLLELPYMYINTATSLS